MPDSLSGRIGGSPVGPYGAGPQGSSANLADILERVLDKGIVIAGDIKVNLLDIELLTIKLRLLVVSVDKAEEMGIDMRTLKLRAVTRPTLTWLLPRPLACAGKTEGLFVTAGASHGVRSVKFFDGKRLISTQRRGAEGLFGAHRALFLLLRDVGAPRRRQRVEL